MYITTLKSGKKIVCMCRCQGVNFLKQITGPSEKFHDSAMDHLQLSKMVRILQDLVITKKCIHYSGKKTVCMG